MLQISVLTQFGLNILTFAQIRTHSFLCNTQTPMEILLIFVCWVESRVYGLSASDAPLDPLLHVGLHAPACWLALTL